MDKKEFELEKKLIELRKKAELEVAEVKHKNHLQEIMFEKETKLELQRIKSAEIKRTIQGRNDKKFMEGYAR